MADVNKNFDSGGAHALRFKNNEQNWHMKGSVSKPLSPKRFDITRSGLSATVKKETKRGGNSR